MYAENLKKLRYELRMSAQALADEMGVSLITMQNYELGKREPKYAFMYQLLTKYKVNINWLMTGQGNMFLGQDKATSGSIDEVQIKALFDKWLAEKGII